MGKIGGVYYMPGLINGIPLKFMFDNGASNVINDQYWECPICYINYIPSYLKMGVAHIEQVTGYLNHPIGEVWVQLRVRLSNYSIIVRGFLPKGNPEIDQIFAYSHTTWQSYDLNVRQVAPHFDNQYMVNKFDYNANIYGLGRGYF